MSQNTTDRDEPDADVQPPSPGDATEEPPLAIRCSGILAHDVSGRQVWSRCGRAWRRLQWYPGARREWKLHAHQPELRRSAVTMVSWRTM